MAEPWSVIVPYTIPAALSIANLLDQTAIQLFGKGATVTLYGTADAAGDTFTLQAADGASAPKVLVTPSTPVPVASTVGSAKTNENFIGQFSVPDHSRLSLPIAGVNGHTGRFLFVVG
jgi:hypothetical protein